MNTKALLIVSLLSANICAASPVVSIAAGYMHDLALRADGSVVAWGDDSYQQVSGVNNLTGVKAIAAGGYQSLLLKNDNTLVNVGDIDPTNLASYNGKLKSIACCAYNELGLKPDSSAVAWGNVGATEIVTMPAGLKAIGIYGGFHYCAAVKLDHTVVTWGDESHAGTIPSGLANVVSVACGRYHALALKNDGSVVAWGLTGAEATAQGIPGTTAQTTVPSGLVAKGVAAGDQFSAALKTDGTVVAWGSVPAGQQPAFANVIAIVAGRYHLLALKADGSLVTWGGAPIPNTITKVLVNPLKRPDLVSANSVAASQTSISSFDLTGRISHDVIYAQGSRSVSAIQIAKSEEFARIRIAPNIGK